MASQVEIVNQALTKLGAQRIVSMTDDNRNAETMNAIWNVKRDAELAAQPWTFATKRVELPASSTAPAYGWAFSYPLPADFLSLVEIGEDYVFYSTDGGPVFQIESDPASGTQAILTNESSPLQLRYVYRVTNAGLYPALFVEALACRLAAEACEAITQSLSKQQARWDERKAAIREARRVNAIEQPPRKSPMASWEYALVSE